MSSIFILCSFEHPIKLKASLIEYDEESNNLKIECKVFSDDFENTINRKLTKNIDFYQLTQEDRLIIEEYFKTNYKVSINTNKLDLQLLGAEFQEAYNIVILKFMTTKINI